MDYREYSRQRDIAVKRVKRLQEAGVKINVHIPTVKELRAMEAEKAGAMESALHTFLESGASLQRRKESQRVHYTQEEQAERRREYQRDYRRRKVAQAYGGINKKKYESYLKGIKTLGVDLKPSQLPTFFEYMDYRFSQGNSSKKYVFDIFVDDYQTLLRKGYKPEQIITDFQQFVSDKIEVVENQMKMNGTPFKVAMNMWDWFVGGKNNS